MRRLPFFGVVGGLLVPFAVGHPGSTAAGAGTCTGSFPASEVFLGLAIVFVLTVGNNSGTD